MLQPVDRMPTPPPIAPIAVGAGSMAGPAGTATAVAAQAANFAVTSSAGAGGRNGGGYRFSPEEIDAVIKQWEQLREGLEDDLNTAQDVANVKGPGREFASGDFEKAAGPSGRALVEQTRRMLDYVQRYIQALKDAQNATKTQDEQAREEVNKTGGMLA